MSLPSPARQAAALLAPHRGRIALAIACSAIAGAGVGAYAYLAGPAVRTLVAGGALSAGPLERVLPAALVARLSSLGLGLIPALLVLTAAIKAAASAGAGALLPGAVARAAADLRRLLFRRLLRADPRFYEQNPTGDLVSRVTADVAALEAAGVQVLGTLIRDVAHALALLGVCLLVDLRLLAAAAVIVPGVFLPVRRFARTLRRVNHEQLAKNGELARRAEQMIQGHRVVTAYGGEAHESRRFAAVGAELIAVMKRSLLLRGAYSPTLEILGVIALAGGIAVAGRAIAAGTLRPEAVISFAAAAMLLYTPLKALGNLGEQLARLEAAAARAFALLHAPDAIADDPSAPAVPAPAEVRLEDVTVRYGERIALDRLNLTFRAGETVAIVGESGAGKSTVAALLLRFVDPSEGRVLWDGADVRAFRLASLRSHVGFVPQDTVIFAGTAADNIRCGADLPEGEVRRAAREASADVWIEKLPGRYAAELSEKGQNLSGGERQRLGIARALARESRLLVLDEATSALDAQSDALLQAAFARALSGHRIGVVITHRLASVRGVDRVVVLEKGRVVEQGTPEELMASGGWFARSSALQGLAEGA